MKFSVPYMLSCSLLLSGSLCAETHADLVEQLNAETYEKRAEAHLALESWAKDNPEDAIGILLEYYKKEAAPEAKSRLLGLIKDRVIFEKYGKPKGFVGIRMDNGAEKINGEVLSVVLVTEVVDGSPADQFGIEQGDAIFSVDRKQFNRNAVASMQFIEMVTSKREGDRVEIELMRGGEVKKVSLVLGAMPAELERQQNFRTRRDPVQDREDYFDQWLDQNITKKSEPPK
ncbi:PDZ domain-containing protein [Rubritalea tangerina]|uniref:PDZ domain-containing protein n=1 Tax=Rubritalea tangerina TaxID=430798 RepID=A0ABW4ZCP9_9BACT